MAAYRTFLDSQVAKSEGKVGRLGVLKGGGVEEVGGSSKMLTISEKGDRWVHAFCVIAGQWDYWILPHRLRLFVAFWGSWICCQSTVTFWRGPSFWLENEKDHKPSKPFQSNDDDLNWSRRFPTTSLRVERNFRYFQVTRLYFRGCGLRCVILVDRMIVAQMLGGWSLSTTKLCNG